MGVAVVSYLDWTTDCIRDWPQALLSPRPNEARLHLLEVYDGLAAHLEHPPVIEVPVARRTPGKRMAEVYNCHLSYLVTRHPHSLHVQATKHDMS